MNTMEEISGWVNQVLPDLNKRFFMRYRVKRYLRRSGLGTKYVEDGEKYYSLYEWARNQIDMSEWKRYNKEEDFYV